MLMKTLKPDFKKITGLLGALLFAGSMMIGHLPVNAVAGDSEPGEEACNNTCPKGSGDCVSNNLCKRPI